MSKILVVAGPTASGKSDIAISLAKEHNGIIINADSRQVYKELKIGSAQPIPDSIEENYWYIGGIRHYLYGYVSVEEDYNLFRYQKDAKKIIDESEQTIILVGGTGLYIDSVVFNYNLTEIDSKYDRALLSKFNKEELQELIDKDILLQMNESDRNNPRRLIRVIERGGLNYQKGEQLDHEYYVINIDNEILFKRIEQRVDKMLEGGLIEENKELIEKGYTYDMSALNSIGYQEFDGYFEGKKSIEQVREDIILHTKQYAKRQKTWFKRHNTTPIPSSSF